MGKVNGEIIGRSVKDSEIVCLSLKKGDVMGKMDGEILDKSVRENEIISLSLADDGQKHDSDEMIISEESRYCKGYQMEDLDLPFCRH